MTHITALKKNSCLEQIQIFLWLFSFSNLLRKLIFLSISELLSVKVIFLINWEVFCKCPQKCFKTLKKHSLAVCGSFWGEKQFLLLCAFFYWFDQKQWFQQIQISSGFAPFQINLWKKILFEYFCAFLWYSTFFLLKREVFSQLDQKCFEIIENHSLAICGSLWGEKQFLLIYVPFNC